MNPAQIVEPGVIAPPSPELPAVRLAERARVFARRAARLEQLAAGHAAGDFLRFVARLVNAQQAVLDSGPAVTMPDETQLARCRQHGLPPLSISGWRREPVWHEILHALLATVRADAPPPTRAVIDRATAMHVQVLETEADALLVHNHAALDLGAAPFIGAALQVYWTRLAAGLDAAVLPPPVPATLCPACGSLPVASVIRIGPEHGRRYLTCSLCATEWHMVRVKCAHCESTKGIGYHTIEGGSPAIRAEGCDECRHYLKAFYMDKDSDVEAAADDLASLALDFLMADAGYERAGANLLLIPGQAAEPPPTS
jgi:FdhE protein